MKVIQTPQKNFKELALKFYSPNSFGSNDPVIGLLEEERKSIIDENVLSPQQPKTRNQRKLESRGELRGWENKSINILKSDERRLKLALLEYSKYEQPKVPID